MSDDETSQVTITPDAAVTLLMEETFEDREFVCLLAKTAYTNEDLTTEVPA